MRKKIIFVLLISLTNIITASKESKNHFTENHKNKTIKTIQVDNSKKKVSRSIPKEKLPANKKKQLSEKEKKRNFFMRTGLQILGTFIFLFVLFLVFRIKKK